MAKPKNKPTPAFEREIDDARRIRPLKDRADAFVIAFLRERRTGKDSDGNRELVRGQLIDVLGRMRTNVHKLPNGKGVRLQFDKPKLSSDPVVRERQVRQLEQYANRKWRRKAPKPITRRVVTVEEINPDFLEFIDGDEVATRRVQQIVPPVARLCAFGEECDFEPDE